MWFIAGLSNVKGLSDAFHIQKRFEQVTNVLIRRVQGTEARLMKQAQQMASTSLKDIVAQKLLSQQLQLQRRKQALVDLAQDVRQWSDLGCKCT